MPYMSMHDMDNKQIGWMMFKPLTNKTQPLNKLSNVNNVSFELTHTASSVKDDINWFESKSIAGKLALSKQYITICQQHHQQKKWVLFINPDEASLEQLTNSHNVDAAKVLCVNVKTKYNGNKQKSAALHLNIEQIKSVLCRGNCSAVILSNASFKQTELNALHRCAQQGQTQCLLLKTTEQKEKSH